MSEFTPKIEDIMAFHGMATEEYNRMPEEVPGYRFFPSFARLPLAYIRASLRILNRLGAVKESFLLKHKMTQEVSETSADIDEKIQSILAKHVGERGNTEDLIQTLERIIQERDNVLRNRNRT